MYSGTQSTSSYIFKCLKYYRSIRSRSAFVVDYIKYEALTIHKNIPITQTPKDKTISETKNHPIPK